MNQAFRRILHLARRTGDRIIVTDPEGTDVFVVMGLDQYEAFLSDEPVSPPPAPKPQSVPVRSIPSPPTPDSIVSVAIEDEPARPAPATPAVPPPAASVIPPVSPRDAVTPLPPEPAAAAKPAENEPVSEHLPPVAGDEDDFGEEQFYLEPVE